MKRPARLAQQDGRDMRDGALEEAVALRLDVGADRGDVVAEVVLVRVRLGLLVRRVGGRRRR